jgi:hypothetical protein
MKKSANAYMIKKQLHYPSSYDIWCAAPPAIGGLAEENGKQQVESPSGIPLKSELVNV